MNIHTGAALHAAASIPPAGGGAPEIFAGVSLCFVILAIEDSRLKALCEAKEQPFQGEWSLPASSIYVGKGVRESAEKGVTNLVQTDRFFLEQLQTFSDDDRPALTVAYSVLVSDARAMQAEATHQNVQWKWFDQLTDLRLEDQKLVNFAVQNLRLRALHDLSLFRLLPKKFTLLQLQKAYEAVAGARMSKSNFRRKIAKIGHLVPCQEWQQGVAHRAARLFEIDENKYYSAVVNKF